MRKMRGDADRVRRLVAETEDSLARMILLVRHVPVDIERWDARHGDPPGVPLGHKDAAVQIDPSTEKEDSIPLEDDQGLDDTREVTTEELKAFVQSFRRIRSRVNEEAATAFSREDVRAVTTLSEDWSEEHPALHDCRRSADQQARFDTHKILQPRPRIGVDEQGHPYNDWSACQPEPRPRKRLQRERVVMSQLWMRFDHLVPETDVRLHPAPICPRQPRIFADQHQVRFSDVPQTVHYVLERWHRTYGRCCDCIVRAMRTFPPWIMKTHEADESMDGNPVFTNNLDDELVEWDETRRRWRHLVLDHYRWIPVHDLEERTNDSTADPEILNGTTDVPVPEDDWAWTRVDLSTLRGVY
ncbi:hypothetical protein PUNSTDRAFT_136734 [Punctularia strigosozonata HHB-11173 SS5]|uniref:uncharacterized protein n=1 Tax=Punctularia strigosozonata (strain HHB-11173) TaxID=741275 RepID=UPI0004416265|nr:uncharacterized protein PUNSTDRAFT_136734 [Punctularia strigosozonata HHB-11173 SS5]EIN06918.1 hypothetical protein PUNSTDRAFT_136734 [Punctularia strigosozonata HHB-11173 SS5]